jgi:hypothetical protein
MPDYGHPLRFATFLSPANSPTLTTLAKAGFRVHAADSSGSATA